MNCPECCAKLTVIDSRPVNATTTRRRLVCPECDARYTSIERLDLEYTPVDVQEVFTKIANKAIVRSGYMSSITGGTYTTKEDAVADSIAELNRLYKEGN